MGERNDELRGRAGFGPQSQAGVRYAPAIGGGTVAIRSKVRPVYRDDSRTGGYLSSGAYQLDQLKDFARGILADKAGDAMTGRLKRPGWPEAVGTVADYVVDNILKYDLSRHNELASRRYTANGMYSPYDDPTHPLEKAPGGWLRPKR